MDEALTADPTNVGAFARRLVWFTPPDQRSQLAAAAAGIAAAHPTDWLAWLTVHIFYLIGFENRMLVLVQWAWSYLSYERGARLITGAWHGGAPPD